ncbi:hypothetical protein PoB_004598000 [Plakobranchus ocellatus]|uniref:Uncharacterized protein n=1 Tax=Plakobranchus ocellatus TaxID=259542 RepID=A0AAV4BJ01_9GAST|nr:hypothetical protein PoB_004598000 [Plakobranchus ocellatus]
MGEVRSYTAGYKNCYDCPMLLSHLGSWLAKFLRLSKNNVRVSSPEKPVPNLTRSIVVLPFESRSIANLVYPYWKKLIDVCRPIRLRSDGCSRGSRMKTKFAANDDEGAARNIVASRKTNGEKSG